MDVDQKFIVEALSAITEPVFILDSKLQCVFSNGALRDFVGLSMARGGKLSVAEFWPDLAKEDLSQSEMTAEFQVSGRARVPVKLSIIILQSGYRMVRVMVGPLKSHYFHSQRLETLGMLAGGIAHDFNNVLAGILGHITYLKTILPQSGPHVESLCAIEDGGRKASLMTQEILNFSRLDTAEKRGRVDICLLVEKTCRLLRGAISPEYQLELDLPREAVSVLGVEGKLAQVIVNLVMNARDAVTSDGVIKVRVRAIADCSGKKGIPESLQRKGACCLLEVEDSGHGMSPEVLSRVYEPYFSTKKDKGTGLGLSTVISIVRSFAGGIIIESTPGKGTCASVYLPLAEPSLRKEPSVEERQQTELACGDENILIVDDEDPVRNVLCVSLLHLGYQVDIAASGTEALERVSNAKRPYDLIILDMLMPNLSGDEVFFRIREMDPNVRVLVISGYSSEDAVNRILKNGGKGFIQKPFTIEDLSRKVRECLDE